MKDLLQKLVETPSPSGYESKIREVIKAEIAPFVDEIKVDPLGSLIAHKGQKSEKGQTILLSAHMDEIGVMVTHVDENGFARFTNLGAVFPRNAVGGRVRFLNGAAGVIGLEPQTNRTNVPELNKMFIDLGANSAKDCPVEIGDVAVFERKFEAFGDRLVSKAMDNRTGVAVLIEIAKQLKSSSPHQIYFVFSVQEEVGARGAGPAAFGIEPDFAIAVDVTVCGDTPQSKATQVKLGAGPAVHIKDVGAIANPRISAWIEQGAKKAKIPTQVSILTGGYTDNSTIQSSRGGVPVGGVSIPCRYVHTPSEMVDLNDLNNSVKLLTFLLSNSVNL